MFFQFFLLIPLLAQAAATTTTTVPQQQINPVEVHFVQAFLLVPDTDKQASLRSILTRALFEGNAWIELNSSDYSPEAEHHPLFQEAISRGFSRYWRMEDIDVKPLETGTQRNSPLPPHLHHLFNYLFTYGETFVGEQVFSGAKYLMGEYLFIFRVLASTGKGDIRLLEVARNVIAKGLGKRRVARIEEEEQETKGRMRFQLSSPSLAAILPPSPNLSLKIYTDFLERKDANRRNTLTALEKTFNLMVQDEVGKRGFLVEEDITVEKLKGFDAIIMGMRRKSNNAVVTSAATFALAKGCDTAGYLPFPNYRNPYELYLNNILQARMLLSLPDLRRVNLFNLKLTTVKSIDATRVFLEQLPVIPNLVLSANLLVYKNAVSRLVPLDGYYYSDFTYWRTVLEEAFPVGLLPPAPGEYREQKLIIDCYTIEASIALLRDEPASSLTSSTSLQLPKAEDSYETIFSDRYLRLSQAYLHSMTVSHQQCPQYSPYFERVREQGKPLTVRELLLFEITIAQVMHYKDLPCLRAKIAYAQELLEYLGDYDLLLDVVDEQTLEYATSQIQLMKS